MSTDLVERATGIAAKIAAAQPSPAGLTEVLTEIGSLIGAQRGALVLRWPVGALYETAHFDLSPQQTNSYHAAPPARRSASFIRPLSALALRSGLVRAVERDGELYVVMPVLVHDTLYGEAYFIRPLAGGPYSEESLRALAVVMPAFNLCVALYFAHEQLAQPNAQAAVQAAAKAEAEANWLKAVEANKARTELLIKVTHDLRAPLTIVLATLLMLKDGEFGELTYEQSDWLGRARDAATRALNLTNDVFDLSRLETQGLKLYREVVNLGAFLHSVYDIGRGLPWRAGVALRLDLPPDLPDVIIDPDRIQQVLLNLLSNAMKFTERGTVTLRARVNAEAQEVVVSVSDTGRGIAPEHLSRLFSRFPWLDGPPRSKQSGTGLGLAICRELVEMHGGRIWAESVAGQGAEFRFALQLHQEQA